jgi:hypothetical protein
MKNLKNNKRLVKHQDYPRMATIVIAIAIGGGVYFLLGSHAATPEASVGADSGTLTSGAVVESSSSAADGSYVQFGSTSSVGYSGSCSKTISPGTDLASSENTMSAGQTLCLNSGHYGSTSTLDTVSASGTSGSPITITSAPGQTATIEGMYYWAGSYLVVEHLNIDNSSTEYDSNGGSNPAPCPYPISGGMDIDASNDTFQDDNIYESVVLLRGVVIGIGYFSQVNNTIIRYDNISDGGSCNQTQHLIYNDNGSGSQIYDNWMWNDPYGYAIQLYPNPGDARVYSNVFDGTLNGIVDATAVGGNQTYNNIAINSVARNPGGFSGGTFLDCFGGSTGATDTVENNAYWNEVNGFGCAETGVTESNNIELSANPFVDSADHNYNLSSSAPSSIQSYNLWNGVGPPTPDPAP